MAIVVAPGGGATEPLFGGRRLRPAFAPRRARPGRRDRAGRRRASPVGSRSAHSSRRPQSRRPRSWVPYQQGDRGPVVASPSRGVGVKIEARWRWSPAAHPGSVSVRFPVRPGRGIGGHARYRRGPRWRGAGRAGGTPGSSIVTCVIPRVWPTQWGRAAEGGDRSTSWSTPPGWRRLSA